MLGLQKMLAGTCKPSPVQLMGLQECHEYAAFFKHFNGLMKLVV